MTAKIFYKSCNWVAKNIDIFKNVRTFVCSNVWKGVSFSLFSYFRSVLF